jgi:hypothetical protein
LIRRLSAPKRNANEAESFGMPGTLGDSRRAAQVVALDAKE